MEFDKKELELIKMALILAIMYSISDEFRTLFRGLLNEIAIKEDNIDKLYLKK